ncbi:FAD-binding protein [Geodermatophilus sabuli]|uniref:FAD-binding protein n=1 Tax=Geodermatophilus sabuli TaxID=1564158 RepID=A0A7K3VVV8_9ACTN|nr:FAD-dependent monooxygenase [Geodermatophilus sabuli]NEK56775.1 FAD-binding protein [Geodermatophilus sabuli]
MDQPVRRVLVVGGGTAGSVLTLALRQRGLDVVLVERQSEWKAIGHGITIQGNALRALRDVGVADEVVAAGAPFDRLRMRTVDGELIQEIVSPPLGGDDLPPTMGSMRFLLQEVLSRHVHDSGADVRLGTAVEAIEDDGADAGVAVALSDGSREVVDLVVGADGQHSTVRSLIGVEARRRPVGMAIWRMEGPRQPGMDCAELYYGGPRYKAGYAPISPDRMYAYVLDEDRRLESYGDRPLHELMAERAEGYGGLWPAIRASMGPDTTIDYRSLDALLIDGPWHQGRVLLIGDAAHACPPMLAQGAAMAAEDAIVLAELIGDGHPVDTVLCLFMERRQQRAAMVVDNSVQLARWEVEPDTPGADPAGLMRSSMEILAGPY